VTFAPSCRIDLESSVFLPLVFIGPRPEETIPNPTWCLGISMVWERGRRKYGWEVDFPKEDYEVEVDESGKEDGTAVTMGGVSTHCNVP